MTFITMSLDTLRLSRDKRAEVQQIQADLHMSLEKVADARTSLLDTIADGVAAGGIDEARVNAALTKLYVAASAAEAASNADALDRLHDLLSPEERQLLSEKLERHWGVYREVNVLEKPGTTTRGSRLDHLSKDLSLTADQENAISTALSSSNDAVAPPSTELMDAHVRGFAAGFAGAQFEARAFNRATVSADLAMRSAERMAHFYEAVTPVLTAKQRDKLAAKVRRLAIESDR